MPQAKTILLAVTLAEHGGVQEFLLRLAVYLRAQGHRVSIAAGDGEWLFEICERQGIATHRLRHLQRALHPWKDARATAELVTLLRQLQPDAIHLNSSKMGALGALAARLTHVPRVVYRIGGWVFLEPLSRGMCWLYTTVEKISARWKDTIICVHPADTNIAASLNIRPRDRVVTIPNGIDLTTFETQMVSREDARSELDLTDDTFVFGTIANFFPAKDLPRYLEACASVHAQYPNTSFVILGEGLDRDRIEKQRQRLQLEKIVTLPGRVEKAARLLRAFDAYVLPSAKEGMSWSLLEAMAAERPCIATDVGANRWLLDPKAGWIIPAQDPHALAQAMLDCLQHPDQARTKAAHAKQRIQHDFPLNKTLKENASTLI